MADASKPPDDDITQRLRAAVRRKRPWTFSTALLALLVFGLPPAFLLWFFWPRAHPPELIVLGFDQLTPIGKPVTVRAATEPPDHGEKRWGGQTLFFEEMTPDPAQRDKTVEVRTDKYGVAEKAWHVQSPGPIAEIEVRYLDESVRPVWFERARLRVFQWPAESRILVVDVEPTLKKADDWQALANALAAAHAANWKLVYLATDADTPLAYTKQRDWLIQKEAAVTEALPNGPVLARQALWKAQPATTARKKALAALKADFTGPVIVVTAESGLSLQAVGQTGDLIGQPTSLSGWSNLAAGLPK